MSEREELELYEVEAQKAEEEKKDIKDYNEDAYFGKTRVTKEETEFTEKDKDVIVSMKNVHKTYLLGIEGVPALRGVSLSVKKGEFLCIFGTSGGGKTTLLNIMGTIDKPTKGEIKICGSLVNSNTPDTVLSSLRLNKLGFVFQTFNLLSSLTAIENVEMPMILSGVLSPSERRTRAKELLEMVGMGKRLNHVPSQLSGGEQQRVTIARAIANYPELLLLDEPTGDLDTVNSLIVMKLLTDLNQKRNITLVMVTHDVGLKNFADRVIWMRDGKIARMEAVPKEKKQEAMDKLLTDLEDVRNRKPIKPSEVFTEFREPTDYKTNPKFVHREVPTNFSSIGPPPKENPENPTFIFEES
jgi:putative ABC transport system ATP-binding protein